MSISTVQANTNRVTSTTTVTVTLSSGVTQGNLLVAAATTGNASGTWTAPSGWSLAINGTGVADGVSIYYIIVTSAMAGTTAFTWTLSVSANLTVYVSEWNSTTGWQASPLDQTAKNNGSGTALSTGTTPTTTQASELWIGGLSYASAAQTESGLTSGWTSGVENTGTPILREVYEVASATGAASASFSITTSANWGGAVATFIPASSLNPALSTNPTSLTFSASLGGANPASQNDTLSETNGAATAWTSAITYGSGSGWLAISPTSGNLAAHGTATITVSPTTGSLAAGSYTATVTFTATTGGATATISVTFNVIAPALSTSPSSLSFSAIFGGANPASQNSTLSETHGVATAWTSSITYGSGSGWLAISPTSGSLAANGNTSLTASVTTGTLAVGTYSATITTTATTGGATATISVSFVIHNTTPPYSIKLAGQDITMFVEQMSLVIDDTLGQGSGAGSSGSTQGRAATIKFNTSLGPMNRALGAGQVIPPTGGPYLVRQGEIIVLDTTGTTVFGGYATKYTDTTTSVLGNTKQPFTTVEGIDYSTSLQRTLVNEVFSGVTDIFIIKFIMQKYAPWVNLTYLPTTPAYTFAVKNFRNQTVEQVIQTVAGITGYLVYIDYKKFLHYVSPTVASSAPYNISDNPDFVTTFPARITEFLVDDNSAINRVFFYGGSKLSNNFNQDVTGQADGTNLIFVLAFYPSPESDGNYHVTVGGTAYTVGTANGTGPSNQFISQGGTAQVLVDPGSRSATFDTGLAPAGGATKVLIGYRYSYPLSLVLTDENSHRFFGNPYLDGSIDDNTIFDITTAVQRCKVLLSQQSFGLVTLKMDVWNHPGVQSGMVINVKNTVRGINGTYLVQEVQIEPLGGGNFIYHFTLGAWNWGLIDFLLKLPTLSTFQDNQTQTQETVFITQVLTNVKVHDAWTKSTRTGPYYARSAPVGDGHDAYPGLFTISS